MKKITARLFGSPTCEDCRMVDNFLKENNIPYKYIDANDDGNSSVCDTNDVFLLPYLQVLSDNRFIILEVIGDLSTADKKKILAIFKGK